MRDCLHMFFAAAPLVAIALAVLSYLFGKIRIGRFVPGQVAATLLVAIALEGR